MFRQYHSHLDRRSTLNSTSRVPGACHRGTSTSRTVDTSIQDHLQKCKFIFQPMGPSHTCAILPVDMRASRISSIRTRRGRFRLKFAMLLALTRGNRNQLPRLAILSKLWHKHENYRNIGSVWRSLALKISFRRVQNLWDTLNSTSTIARQRKPAILAAPNWMERLQTEPRHKNADLVLDFYQQYAHNTLNHDYQFSINWRFRGYLHWFRKFQLGGIVPVCTL